MLFTMAVGPAVWPLGVVSVYRVGDVMHVLLLIGLMLLSIDFVKARDTAAPRRVGGRSDER
jgi:hypothetical protein